MSKLIQYFPLIDFLGEVLGKNSEVVLHDLSDLDNSIVAIKNNHVTNRNVGDSATDLVLKILKDHKHENRNYITNYVGKKSGTTQLKSSTYFIREADEIVGMICINTDDSILDEVAASVYKMLDTYHKTYEPAFTNGDALEAENLTQSTEDISLDIIENFAKERGVAIDYLKQDDKIEVVRELNEKGLFLLKGAVPTIAEQLQASEPSIYRYLQIVKKEEEKE